jgi:hypothetical protein
MRREKDFRVTMTKTEKTALERLAEVEGLSQAAVVRRLLRVEARERGIWPAAASTPGAADRRRAVGP